MSHLYSDFVFCKNNFFQNPNKIKDFANTLKFSFQDKAFPGSRTENIVASTNPLCKEFTNFFVTKLINEVYTNILDLTIDIRFHKYPTFINDELNTGWIHIDDNELLAGVVYLNNDFENFESGTSIFTANNNIQPPDTIREEFNIDATTVEHNKYKKSLISYNNQFKETIRIGNLYNRLVTYDSSLYHRPNSYYIDDSSHRFVLVFVISKYSYKNRQYIINE